LYGASRCLHKSKCQRLLCLLKRMFHSIDFISLCHVNAVRNKKFMSFSLFCHSAGRGNLLYTIERSSCQCTRICIEKKADAQKIRASGAVFYYSFLDFLWYLFWLFRFSVSHFLFSYMFIFV